MIYFLLFLYVFNTHTPVNDNVTVHTGATPMKTKGDRGIWVSYDIKF